MRLSATFALPLILALGLAALLQLPWATVAAAAPQSPAFLDEFGVYTMRDLGYSDIVLRAGDPGIVGVIPGLPPKRYAPERLEYRLPDGAAQGPDVWYVLHFHFEVVFSDDADGGEATVYASPNRWTVFMIDFEPSLHDGSPRVDWRGDGIADGPHGGTVDSNQVEVRFSKYLPNPGVVPGFNGLSFAVREDEGATVDTFRIFDDTAIEVTPLAPPDLQMEVEDVQPVQGEGCTVEVTYSVTNAGGWPIHDIASEVSYPEDVLRLVQEPSEVVPLLEGSDSATGSLRLEITSPGGHPVSLRAHGSAGGGAAAWTTVAAVGGSEVPKERFWLLLAGVVAVSLLLVLPYRRLLRRK